MQRPLRVCHISTVHMPFDQRVFHRECWSVARAGHEVHLLVQLDEPEKVVQGIHVHSIGPVRKHSLGLRLGNRLGRVWRAAAKARALHADVYHFHDPELIPLGIWLKRVTQSVVIFDCHENNTGYIQQKHYLHPIVRGILLRGMAFMERQAAKHLDAIVTADAGVENLFRETYGAKRVVAVHNFPRLDLFDEETTSGQARPYDLVYHGTIPRYHLEVSFEVASELQRRGVDAHWLFFGKCPEAEWARGEADRRGLHDNFTIDPNLIPHDEVAARVRQARVGFIPLPDLPKFQHNIPTKLFEFMGLGMPTVLSDLPPSRPFVGDGRCAVMVAPDDYVGYADAIEGLLADVARADEMGREAQRRARSHFNWELESVKLLDLYAELTNEAGR